MGFASFFSSPGGAAAIQAGGSIIGGLLGSEANDDAAKDYKQAVNRAIAYQRQADKEAKAQYRRMRLEAQPGMTRMNQNIAYSGRLTPAQEAEMNELRRRSINAVSTSGLKGSGRAVTAAVRDVESDARRNFLDDNARRGDAAAGQLVQPYFAASGDIANINIQGGQNEANAAISQGMNQGQAGVANANVWGETIGQITSAIQSAGRKSRYTDAMKDLEQRIGTGSV
jgi:hypothetical protein